MRLLDFWIVIKKTWGDGGSSLQLLNPERQQLEPGISICEDKLVTKHMFATCLLYPSSCTEKAPEEWPNKVTRPLDRTVAQGLGRLNCRFKGQNNINELNSSFESFVKLMSRHSWLCTKMETTNPKSHLGLLRRSQYFVAPLAKHGILRNTSKSRSWMVQLSPNSSTSFKNLRPNGS